MGILIATTGPDLLSGEHQNVTADYYGTARLAPTTNLVPDPGLFDYDEETEKHRYWLLGEAPRPTHWAPFVKDRNTVQRMARQVSVPLPLRTPVIDIEDGLVHGPSPLPDDRTVDIPNPALPRVRVINMPQIGFPEGFYTIAFGWVLGDNWQHSARVTNPGPRMPGPDDTGLFLAQGQGILITMPTEINNKATAVAIFMSEPRTTALAALTAPMYRIARFRTKGLNQFQRLRGPFKWQNKVNLDVNNTYVGDKTQLAKLRVWRDDNPFGVHEAAITVKLRYTVFMDTGSTTMTSEEQGPFHAPIGRNSVRFKPRKFPPGAVGWRPEAKWLYPDGDSDWRAITKKGGENSYFRLNEAAGIWVGIAKFWPKHAKSKLEKVGGYEVDRSGIREPSETLELPTVLSLNSSGLTPGIHLVKNALYAGEDEGPDSRPTRVNVGAGQAIRILRPLFHNRLDNEDLSDRNPTDVDIPRGWILPDKPFPTGVIVRPPREGVIKYLDNSNAATNFMAFKTPYAHLEPDIDRYMMRFKIDIPDYTSGKVRLILEEYATGAEEDEAPSVTTNIEVIGRAATAVMRHIRLSRQVSDPTRPDVLRLQPNTAAIRLRVDGIGNGKTGVRNFDVEFSHWGVFEGWGRPRKADRLDQQRGGKNEPEDVAYPHGGYCIIREDPTDGPRFENFTVLNRENFEDQAAQGWTNTQTLDGATAHYWIHENYAIRGQYGLRLAKSTPNTTDNTFQNYISRTFGDVPNAAFAFEVFNKHQSAHPIDLMDFRNEAGTLLAVLRLQASGNLDVLPVTGLGVLAGTTIAKLDDEEHASVELELDNGGTTNGVIRAYVGLNKADRSLTATISSIDWSDRMPGIVTVGQRRLNQAAAATYNLFFDTFLLTRQGSKTTVPQGGNYIECYNPPRTPKNERYGPYGLRIPVRPQRQYTIGVNIASEDLQNNTDLLRVRAMDRNHNELAVYAPVVSNISGDMEWTRFTKTINVPAKTAYIEFFANNLGGGTVWIHGIQVEEGNVATPFSMTHQRDGYLSVFFDTEPEGMLPNDRAKILGEVSKIRRITTLATDDEFTSYLIQYRSGNALPLSGPYEGTIENISANSKYIEVRVDLSSTTDVDTPEVRGIRVELGRPVGILTRENGTEFKGGVLVNNVSGVHAPPNVENVQLASGALAENPWGTDRVYRISFNVYAFRRSAMEEIVESKRVILETPDRRYHVSFEEAPNFTPQPQTRIYVENDEFWQEYVAEGVVGIVRSEESLA